jgi:hypothetical protein
MTKPRQRRIGIKANPGSSLSQLGRGLRQTHSKMITIGHKGTE